MSDEIKEVNEYNNKTLKHILSPKDYFSFKYDFPDYTTYNYSLKDREDDFHEMANEANLLHTYFSKFYDEDNKIKYEDNHLERIVRRSKLNKELQQLRSKMELLTIGDKEKDKLLKYFDDLWEYIMNKT